MPGVPGRSTVDRIGVHDRQAKEPARRGAPAPRGPRVPAALALQRTAGNRAVAAMLQRKSLGQAGLASDLDARDVNAPIIYSTLLPQGPEKGNVYIPSGGAPLSGVSPDRDDALQRIRVWVRRVGQRVEGQNYLTSKAVVGHIGSWGTAAKNDFLEQMIARSQKLKDAEAAKVREGRDKELRSAKNMAGFPTQDELAAMRVWDTLPLLDPFHLEVSVEYAAGDQRHQLTVTTQFATGFLGYVVRVHDTGKGVAATMTASKSTATDTAKLPVTYSSFHHTDKSGKTLAEQIAGISPSATEKENEAGVDAYTKIVAEGARYNCVAALGPRLRDTSRFYFSPGPTRRFGYLTLPTLWGKWVNYGNRYGLTDEDLRTAIRGSRANWPSVSSSSTSTPLGSPDASATSATSSLPVITTVARDAQNPLGIDGETDDPGQFGQHDYYLGAL